MQVIAVGERGGARFVRHVNVELATGLEDTCAFLERSPPILEMLEDMSRVNLPHGVITEGERHTIQIPDDIWIAYFIRINIYPVLAQLLVIPTPQVEPNRRRFAAKPVNSFSHI